MTASNVLKSATGLWVNDKVEVVYLITFLWDYDCLEHVSTYMDG